MATAAEKKAAAAEAKAKEEAAAAKAAEAEIVIEEDIEVEDPPVVFEQPEAAGNEAGVVLIYRRTKTIPGTKKKLFGLDCVANEDGQFETTVSPERAEIEVKRTVLARFEKK